MSRISAPTLIVGGGASSHIPRDKLIDVVARLSDATLLTIPGGHHIYGTRPADFTAAVLDFLQPWPAPRVDDIQVSRRARPSAHCES